MRSTEPFKIGARANAPFLTEPGGDGFRHEKFESSIRFSGTGFVE